MSNEDWMAVGFVLILVWIMATEFRVSEMWADRKERKKNENKTHSGSASK